jgi:hypothetical protein
LVTPTIAVLREGSPRNVQQRWIDVDIRPITLLPLDRLLPEINKFAKLNHAIAIGVREFKKSTCGRE